MVRGFRRPTKPQTECGSHRAQPLLTACNNMVQGQGCRSKCRSNSAAKTVTRPGGFPKPNGDGLPAARQRACAVFSIPCGQSSTINHVTVVTRLIGRGGGSGACDGRVVARGLSGGSRWRWFRVRHLGAGCGPWGSRLGVRRASGVRFRGGTADSRLCDSPSTPRCRLNPLCPHDLRCCPGPNQRRRDAV